MSAIVPPLFRELRGLADNYWWSWQLDGPEVFRDISRSLWETCGHNPKKLLAETLATRRTELDIDPHYRARAQDLIARFRAAMQPPPAPPPGIDPRVSAAHPIAYFSAEFAIHESLPIYAGGLGVLAGDHLKSASDVGLPLVGVGLLYRQGYFLQDMDRSNWQSERYVDLDVPSMPIERVMSPDGRPLSVTVIIHRRPVHVSIWRVWVGRVPLYLLDTNREDNEERDRWITGHLYGGNQDTRLVQEMTLGFGGVRALRAIGLTPSVFHMNEGHSAFLTLELLREGLAQGAPLEEATKAVKAQCVFTTHTPVTAGHDVFGVEFMDTHLAAYWNELGLTRDQFFAFGRRRPDDHWEPFGMTPLAMRFARSVNGVSRRHGEVCREMFRDFSPEREPAAVPIRHVTNGIHVPTWAAPVARSLLAHYLGAGWEARLGDPGTIARIDDVPDAELWEMRNQLRRYLVAAVRARAHESRTRNGEDPDFIAAADHLLDPDVLTIGFARRMATYKRMSLIIHDQERTARLLTDDERPVQFVLAGKAHPFDNEAKRNFQELARWKRPIEHLGRIVYLENYDVSLARFLVQGCDVWLNLPRRPLEASGTSGQKVIANGGLNCSILDGWWCEGFADGNGWAIGAELDDGNADAQDDADAEALYRVLENEVVPLFYERDERGIPAGWLARVRASMRSLLPTFNTDRMVLQYAREVYGPPA
ncbi:MAG: alpha-glucan family phosphorylase [Deltaproteobacteria bacterium]|nr:alpha-glucan family phosphorylase [Deltaproteobacteria bacterium]